MTPTPAKKKAPPCSPLDWRTDFDEHDNATWEANGPYTDEDGSCEYMFKITQRLREDRHEFVEDSDAELMMDDEDPRVWLSLAEAQQAMARDYADIVRDCAGEANAERIRKQGAMAQPKPPRANCASWPRCGCILRGNAKTDCNPVRLLR